ncbi:MAG: lysine biosynthesis protein LysW [Candidatus Dormibacteria bacterium]
MSAAACPECDAEVTGGDAIETGEILPCSDCGTDLEVMGVSPLRLQVAPPEEEDWGE